MEALFIHNKAEIMLDERTKAALRLCNKHFKNLVDATVIDAEKDSDDLNLDLNALLNTEWHSLETLTLKESFVCQNRLTELPSALFIKFSRLETLKIVHCVYLKALPEEIGELSHLKSLDIKWCDSLTALPSSLGKLTTLEKTDLWDCHELTDEDLAPLQHLPGLTSLELAYCDKLITYPEFIWNLTSLKELCLYSASINTLPDALGNLRNLEKLTISMEKLQKLPESVGNLNALKWIDLDGCFKLTTLPESLDDLLWCKAHETGESKMRTLCLAGSRHFVLSPKIREALPILERNGALVSVHRSY